jgi:hypothetical protein
MKVNSMETAAESAANTATGVGPPPPEAVVGVLNGVSVDGAWVIDGLVFNEDARVMSGLSPRRNTE